MDNNKLLPLFSNSFRELLQECYDKHGSKIANILLSADATIEGFNKYFPEWMLNSELTYIRPEHYRYLLEWKEDTLTKIDSIINDSIRMITLRNDVFELSFLPKGKDPKYTDQDTWSKENRQTGKPTRLLQKLIVSKEFSNYEFETFNNQLRALSEANSNFQLVSGSDIAYWYDANNYYDCTGTLGNSCMRYDNCNDYFKIYEENAEMLILLKNNKLLGRAIVWTIDGDKYVDRIYTCKDHLVEKFITYVKNQNWRLRENQHCYSSGDTPIEWLIPEDNYKESHNIELTICLPKLYDYWPYLDTFRYLNDDGKISISTYEGHIGYFATLDDTEGNFYRNDKYTCGYCGVCIEYDDDARYNDWEDEYLCPDCAVWSNIHGSYIRDNECIMVYYNSFDDYDYAMLEYVRGHLDLFIESDGKWFSINSPLLNKDENFETEN